MFVSQKSQNNTIITSEAETAVRPEQLQAAAFSFICAVCTLFVAAAATRIPAFLEASEVGKIAALTLFGGIVLLCVVDNVSTHLALSQK